MVFPPQPRRRSKGSAPVTSSPSPLRRGSKASALFATPVPALPEFPPFSSPLAPEQRRDPRREAANDRY